MKQKVTAASIRKLSAKKIALGYCEAPYLLRNHEPIAYTAGIYGWNFDVYAINGVVVCTGYRGMVGSNPKVPVEEYEKRARELAMVKTFEESNKAREEVERLLAEWLEKA